MFLKTNKLLPIMHRLRIEQIYTEEYFFLKKPKVLVMSVVIESLLYLTRSQAKGKFMYPSKP